MTTTTTCYRCETPMAVVPEMLHPQVCQACLTLEERQYELSMLYGMMTEKVFRPDNCTGYTLEEIQRLNTEFEHRWLRGDWPRATCGEAAKWFTDEVAGR